MREWPLIVFTLATQLACGLTVAATVFETRAPAADLSLMRPLAILIFPLLALGMLFSMTHLKRPLASWKALQNLGRSRLSLEVLLTAVFALLALAYSGFWSIGRADGRAALGAASSFAGIAAVISAALVYTVPAQPVWNSGWVLTSFIGTALLAGGLTPAMLIPWKANATALHEFLAAAVAGSLLLLVAAFWMVANLSRRDQAAFASTRLATLRESLAPGPAAWIGCHVLLVAVLPVAAALRVWPDGASGVSFFRSALLLAVLFGAVVGRALMYWLAARYEPF